MSNATRAAYYDPASPDDVNFMCVHCGAQTVTGYDGPGDRGRVSHVYDESDPRYLRSGVSECAPLPAPINDTLAASADAIARMERIAGLS